MQCPDCREVATVEDYYESFDLLKCGKCSRWWTPGEENMYCDNCGEPASIENYNETFDFWTCPHCSSVWSTGDNDPDFDDDSPQAKEAIRERNLQMINQYSRLNYQAIAEKNIETLNQWQPDE